MANLTREQRAEKNKRLERVPVGAANKLDFSGMDPAYRYRVVNDRPGRIPMFQKAGWEFCYTESRNFSDVNETTAMDSRVSLDLGGGDKGYLMRIKSELFDEDQAAKIEGVKNIERAMKRQPSRDNPYKGLTDE